MVEKVSADELRKYSVGQLTSELEAFRADYQRCIQQRHSQSIEPEEVRMARKNITRCTHILREKELIGLVEEYKGRRFIPKQLRPKLNRALRRKLTNKQANAKVRRVRIRESKYPPQIFSFSN